MITILGNTIPNMGIVILEEGVLNEYKNE